MSHLFASTKSRSLHWTGAGADAAARAGGGAGDRFIQRIARTAILVIAVVAPLWSCAALAPHPLPPQVTLDGVRVSRLSPLDTRLTVSLIVRNPNAYDLVVSELNATVAVEDKPLLNGSLLAPATLVAGGDARIEIEARTDLVSIMAAIDRFARQRTVRYELTGSALVQDGMRLPFRRGGELPTFDLQAR